MIPGAFPITAGKPNPSIVFTASANDNTTTTTHTYAAVSIGTATSDRQIIVGTAFEFDVTSVTVGGITATLVIRITTAASRNGQIGLYIVNVPTGTTATIVVTQGSASNGVIVGVWAAYDLLSATAVGTASVSSATSTATVNTNTSANGICVAISDCVGPAGGPAPTSTVSGLTKDFDRQGASNGFGVLSGASIQTTSTETPRSIAFSWSTTSVDGVAASFA